MVLKKLKVMPICDCGYIIKDFFRAYDDQTMNGDVIKRCYFIPSNCPKCGKKIKGVIVKTREINDNVKTAEMFGKIF